MENNENENKTSQAVLRILVIIGILAILVFLSIGIVRIVPRVLNSLANASLSITSLFGPSDTTTNTATTTATSTGGFVIISTSTPSSLSTSTRPSTSPSTSRPSTSYTRPTQTPSRPSTSYVVGGSDLVVTVLEKGIINPANGLFIPTNSFTTSDTVVVKFKVENRGTGVTGPWSLKVTMPSLNAADQVRDIPTIGSLPAGSAIEGQAIFDRPRSDNNPTVVITADPSGRVAELNETNNTATVSLYVSGSNSNGGTGTYQPDLTIRNVQTGTMYGSQFVAGTTIQGAAKVAVRFEVANLGNNPSGSWYFRGELSDNPSRIYNSGAEASIAGNTSVIYVIEFDNVRYGSNTISLSLDPNNYIYESNESNNSASVSFYR